MDQAESLRNIIKKQEIDEKNGQQELLRLPPAKVGLGKRVFL